MMKAAINTILFVCIVLLVYVCYASIRTPIRFDDLRKQREKAVEARLVDIRKAQAAYHLLHHRRYTASFDTLIQFLRTARLPFVYKEGELTEEQVREGLTEEEAVRLVLRARMRGDSLALQRRGLLHFHRDTFWVALLDTLYPKDFRPDSLCYVPYGNGARFEMEIARRRTPAGMEYCLLEVRAPAEVYLKGLDEQGVADWVGRMEQEGKYAGLKIGDLETANNNAGNWE